MTDASPIASAPLSSSQSFLLVGMPRKATAAPEPLATPGRVIRVDADFAGGGVWAGVRPLLALAYREMLAAGQAQLVEQRDYELHRVLPHYRGEIRPRYQCLTDTSIDNERTRFYGLERAYRIINGLVGLLLDWQRAQPGRGRWTILVENFDRAQHLGSRFFAELARRATPGGEFAVITRGPAQPGSVDLSALGVESVPVTGLVDENGLESVVETVLDDAALQRVAAAAQAGDEVELELHHPALLARCQALGDGVGAAWLALRLLKIYNRNAYYFEARSLFDVLLPHFDQIVGDDQQLRIGAISEMNKCLVTIGDQARLPGLIEQLAAPHLTRPVPLATMHYILSMYHLRYAGKSDLALAEHHILQAVASIASVQDDSAAVNHAFARVFIDNGLALIRVRQGRHQDALDLCRSGYEVLSAEVGESRHMLHRSVLIYNVGQVYVMLGRYEEGLAFYRTAMEMDPYFPEYYNDYGNILQKLDQYEEAIGYYTLGLKYGTPNPVLYFNMGICHSQGEQWEEALRCFDVSLDLQPNQPEAHALRGEVLAGLGQDEAALGDYDTSLALAPDAVPVLVNRAVLHYGQGSYELALADMDRVIALDAAEPAHYENRAAIYQALERDQLYRRDLDLAEQYRAAS